MKLNATVHVQYTRVNMYVCMRVLGNLEHKPRFKMTKLWDGGSSSAVWYFLISTKARAPVALRGVCYKDLSLPKICSCVVKLYYPACTYVAIESVDSFSAA